MSRADSPWFRAGLDSDLPIWGFQNGIRVGIWPAGYEGGDGGPRGLLRIGYPILDGGKKQGLVNYIAVEPVVGGRRGFSELERSADGKPGRMIRAGDGSADSARYSGALVKIDGRDVLHVTLHVERFDNGAEPIVDLAFRPDRPNEVALTARAAPGSAEMQVCILTATMGNYGRLRQLWLRDGVLAPADLWPGFAGDEFTPDGLVPADRLSVLPSGDVLVCATTDEKDPHAAPPDPRAPWWAYRGSFPVTQYWRMGKGVWRRDLHLRVNGRRVYWASKVPLPGGLAYENFELVQSFTSNPTFVFGISRKPPSKLGWHASARQ